MKGRDGQRYANKREKDAKDVDVRRTAGDAQEKKKESSMPTDTYLDRKIERDKRMKKEET